MTAIFTRDASYFSLEGLGQKQAEVLDVIRQFGPIFDRAIGLKLGWPINRVVPRRSELVESGLVMGAGTTSDPLTRRSVMLWRVVIPTEVQAENTDVNRSEPSAEELGELARLREKRDMAWRGFNPAIPASRENDWVAFAAACGNWCAQFKRLYGAYPAGDFDEVMRASTQYYDRVRYPAKIKKPRTDAQRSIINDKRRVGKY